MNCTQRSRLIRFQTCWLCGAINTYKASCSPAPPLMLLLVLAVVLLLLLQISYWGGV
jgi:hypothetical protein